ncbi:hypothetical protein AMATHDRAFT_72114 [Amanita thiersii Skay4041]|uniref:Uncharacterized protein n=1 Tax=Amanita thiersii Skay4041 TaxID=703135 RepID=A0A2A9NB15_9AGAR|nr:hypothetical protein AMATHDRAFT_72114 [Amanita thiersii Skay4041]
MSTTRLQGMLRTTPGTPVAPATLQVQQIREQGVADSHTRLIPLGLVQTPPSLYTWKGPRKQLTVQTEVSMKRSKQ